MQSACAMIHQRGPKSLQPITVMVSKNACITVKPLGRDCQQHFDLERVIACVSNPFALNFQRVEPWHFWRTLWGLRVRNIFGLLKVRKVLVPGVPGVVNKSSGPQMAAHKRANKGGRDAYVRYGWTCGFVACAFAFNMFWHMWNCEVEPVMHRFLWNQSMHTSNRFWQIANGFTCC